MYQTAGHGATGFVQAAEAMARRAAAYWAALTKQIYAGVLGYVMATHNPVRVAEETAVINRLAHWRSSVGLARL